MTENTREPQTAFLVAVDTGEYDVERSLEELAELAESAGARVLGSAIQKRESPDPATVVGRGRLWEIARFVLNSGADLLIFDQELTPSQQRNLEEAVECGVLDRTALILDIFAQRAVSNEGRLQVELAQLKYRLPRLAGAGKNLSRLGGGIGTRGPGESKLESDRRHIRRRIAFLEKRLEEMSLRRRRIRDRREKNDFATVAIVGYTNVGKSTLLNALTGAGVLAEDKLFATLDPTARALRLPDGRTVMLVDTVGLVSRLPHHLVEAFHSTLEEAARADLILNVCDVASPEFDRQLEAARELLRELGAGNVPQVTVLNKCDLLNMLPLTLDRRTVLVSARTGQGLQEMLGKIAEALPPTHRRLTLLIPYAQGALLERLHGTGRVLSEEFTPEGALVTAMVEEKLLCQVEEYIR